MKKIFIIFIALVFYSNSAVAVEKMKFKYNFHENLPKKWVTEFKNIMNIVQEVLPIQDNMYDYLNTPEMPIYAWKNTNKNPFPKIKKNLKGSCICGDGSTRWMQLDIQKQDITKKRNRVYSVIVHEYFHIYQIALSENKLSNRNSSPKWLIEGGAKVLQEIYARQYYGKNFLKSDIQDRERWSIKKVSKEPHLYEKHKTSPTKKGFDSNYTGSAFMVLALVNELKKNNISEEEAFELVFREFWIQRSKQFSGWLWQPAFKNTFGMTVEDFYQKLSKYKRKDLKKILPSKTLKIQYIFY
ncbi:hypothetical protein N9387_00315 [Candidatus Pelagibacter sp.]|nr:hypothetical protein [Candidatus Pelagibacter sp.]